MSAYASQALPDRQSVIVDLIVSMAWMVERNVDRAIQALLQRDEQLAGAVFLDEPRINEAEILIDERILKYLRGNDLKEDEVRLMVATLKVNKDLERMGDLAVNIAQRVISLTYCSAVKNPPELQPMAIAVSHMCRKTLRSLIYQDLVLARSVLESDDQIDSFRDHVFQRLREQMSGNPSEVAQDVELLLASRHLERIADHATNIAEDVIFWLRGVDVRHGRLENLIED